MEVDGNGVPHRPVTDEEEEEDEMTTADAPSRVVLYAFATGEPRPAAELRWRPGASVTLTVIDPVEGSIAQRIYDEGVLCYDEQRVVTRNEPEAFMRALVQPSQTTYSEFVDESNDE